MLNWMLWTKKDLKIFHKKHVNVSPNMKLVTSLINFECQPCGIFEGLSYHHEDEVIDLIIFSATAGLGNRINKLVSSVEPSPDSLSPRSQIKIYNSEVEPSPV